MYLCTVELPHICMGGVGPRVPVTMKKIIHQIMYSNEDRKYVVHH